MPNWCFNALESRGKKELIERLLKDIKVEDDEDVPFRFSLNKIIHMPEEYQRNGEWYDWSCKHWGTKWDATCTKLETEELNSDDPKIKIKFDTAWAPPLIVTDVLSKMFPDLVLRHYYAFEDGGDPGYYEFVDGEVKEEREFDLTKEDLTEWFTLGAFRKFENKEELEKFVEEYLYFHGGEQ